MRELVAWARNALIALAALTLFAGVATQLLAAIFGYAAHFGEHAPPWFGFPLYDPWRVSIRNWVFPRWVKVQRALLPAADLTDADPSQAMLFFQGLAPVRARSLYLEGSQATFAANAELKSVAHDWAAPPPPMEPATQAASDVQTTSPLFGAKIRAVLSRRAPPRAKAKAGS